MTTERIPKDLVAKFSERRASTRRLMALRISLYYDRLGLVTCKTRDLSLEGMLLDTGGIRLTSNAQVEVVLPDAAKSFSDPIRIRASVKRVSEGLAALVFRNLDIGTCRKLRVLLNQNP